MFALGIRYLNGWAMATHPSDRERAEWPPHPDRVFMAFAAAHFETEGGGEERAALEWLESLPAPAMAVGDHEQREIVRSYVPVNDAATPDSMNAKIVRECRDAGGEATLIELDKKIDKQAKTAVVTPTVARMELRRRLRGSASTGPLRELASSLDAKIRATSVAEFESEGLGVIPTSRNRQPRMFPIAIPEMMDVWADGMPRVYLTWDANAPSEQREALRTLCSKVTSIGHSASFVQVWVEPSPPQATLVPIDGVAAKHRLRVWSEGRLGHLESRYSAGLRPATSLWKAYGAPTQDKGEHAPPSSRFDSNLLVLRRMEGPKLGLESTLQLTEALRNAVMSHCAQPPPAWISGHEPDGSPSQGPHLAFLSLPDVGHVHADGHLLGVAIAVPRGVSEAQQKHLGVVFFDKNTGELSDIELRTNVGVWRIRLEDEDTRVSLRSGTWTAPRGGSTAWATVTPIVFDRHPKEPWNDADPPRVRAEKQAGYWAEVEAMIAQACGNIGLPRPTEVIARPTSEFIGVPSAGAMPRTLRKDRTEKRQTHATIRFNQPIVGPVLLGAGRYRGYGLCRPLCRGGEA